MNRYATALLRHRLAVIALTLLATALLGWCAAGIKVVIDPSALAPQGHPYVETTKRVESVFGSKYLMIIGLTPRHGDALQPEVLERVVGLTRALERTPGVVRSTILSLAARQAKGIKGTDGLLEARPLLAGAALSDAERAALRQALVDNPLYRGSVISNDFRTAAVMVELKERADGFQAMVEPVRRVAEGFASADVDVVLGGNPVYLAQTEAAAQRIRWLFPLAVLVIGMLHFEAFRTWQGLVLPLVTAIMAVVWSLGLMGLFHRPLDIFNAPAPILILAVAAGHAVQLLKRYYEDYARLLAAGHGPVPATSRKAVIASLRGVGPVMLVAGGVAALGLFSLTVFAIPTVRTFGLFTGLGIVTAVLLEMSFIPAVRSLLRPPAPHELVRESRTRIWDRLPARIGGWLVDRRDRRRMFAATALFTLACAVAAQAVVIDNASKNYFAAWLPIQHDDAFLNRQLGGTNSLYVMVEGDRDDAVKSPGLIAGMERLQRFADREPQVGKTLSIVDFLHRMHRAMNGDAAGAAGALPADAGLVAQYLLMYSLSGEPGDFDAFVDPGFRRAKMTILLRTGSHHEIKALVRRLETEARSDFGPGVRVSFGGDVTQTLALTDTMVGAKLLNIAQVGFAIFAISALVFRSLAAGAIVLAPLAVAVLAVFGAMGALGIPLNIPNSLIAAMAAGIGGDYAIYLLFRIREQSRAGQTAEDAVRQALATAGKASLYVAAAVAGGYGVLAFSIGFNVHLWTALFIGIAMLASVWASLTLVPGLVLAWRPAFVFAPSGRRRPLARSLTWGVLAATALVPRDAPADEPPSALAVMQRSADASRVDDSVATATFTLVARDGGTQVRRTTGTTRRQDNGTDTARLVRFLAPADIQGTSTLLVERAGGEDDLWIYLPALGKVRRLAAANKRDAFFGTDFSYGDTIGHDPLRWTHRLLREEPVDGTPCFVIESEPADDAVRRESGYARRTSWVDEKTFVALRVDVVDVDGHPLKRILASDVRPVGNGSRHQPMRLSAENLQTGHRTTIRFENFKADQGVDARLFTPQRLAP